MVRACAKRTGVGGASKNNEDYVIKFAKKPFSINHYCKENEKLGRFLDERLHQKNHINFLKMIEKRPFRQMVFNEIF